MTAKEKKTRTRNIHDEWIEIIEIRKSSLLYVHQRLFIITFCLTKRIIKILLVECQMKQQLTTLSIKQQVYEFS